MLTQKSEVSMLWSLWEKLPGIKREVDYYPVLTLPEGILGFVVYCDASKIGLGCVLMHNERL